MKLSAYLAGLVLIMLFGAPAASGGVVLKTNFFGLPSSVPSLFPWAAGTHGIENPGSCTGGSGTFGCGEASGGEGLYFGYTSDPIQANTRESIPFLPKFPNIVIPMDSSYLFTFPSEPAELSSAGMGYDVLDTSGSEVVVDVPLGTTLTFHEGDLSVWYNYSTLYRDVDGVPTPFEEFRPLIGDGPDLYTLDTLETVDLVIFGFFTGGIYPEPGLSAIPRLIHINVVPEPGLLTLWAIGCPLLLRRNRGS